MSSHVTGIDIDVYSAFVVIFNILSLEVAHDSMKLFYWYLHYIYDLILYLCIMYYTVCYLAGIFYAVVRQISMLFIDNRISVFCINLRQICDERLNKVERYGLQKYYRTPFAYQNVSSMRPCAKSK